MRPVARALITAALAAAGASLMTATAHAQTPVAARYANLLSDAAAALDRGDVATARSDVGAAAALSSSPDALSPISDDLDASPPNLDDARHRLDAAGVLALPPGAAAPDDAAIRRGLHDVYARPAFSGLDAGSDSGLGYWAQRFGRWLLENTIGRLGRTLGLLVGALAVAAVIAVAWWRLRAVAAGRLLAPPGEPAVAGDDPDAEWSAAEDAAARGDHREAVRRAFRSALLDVAIRGRVALSAAWTTRELLAVVAADADLLAALAPAAASFDRAWYSTHPVTAADWETARARCTVVRRLSGRRREVAV